MRYLFVFLILFLSAKSFAYNFTPASVPQQSKEASRWSLAQWMEQKGKMQWMDLWLNSNVESPSFYEIYMGGDYAQFESTTSVNSGPATLEKDINSWRAHAGAFVSLLGIYSQYEKIEDETREQWEFLGMLRILGHTDQGSNLTGFYGLHEQNFGSDYVRNNEAGGYLTLYLVNFLAIQGKYQHFFENKSEQGVNVDGHRIEASTWVEYGALRIYGTWYKEPLNYTTAIDTKTITREGFYLGVRVYLDFKK